jgi:anti-sigma factor RsiW
MMKLTCKQLVELVTDYLENQLPAETRERFEAHIASCSGCWAYLEQMQTTIQLMGSLSEEKIAEDAKRELLEVFGDWKNTSSTDEAF